LAHIACPYSSIWFQCGFLNGQVRLTALLRTVIAKPGRLVPYHVPYILHGLQRYAEGSEDSSKLMRTKPLAPQRVPPKVGVVEGLVHCRIVQLSSAFFDFPLITDQLWSNCLVNSSSRSLVVSFERQFNIRTLHQHLGSGCHLVKSISISRHILISSPTFLPFRQRL
jgi:hypothetical protein